jgi:hypothetical protein
MKGFNASSEKAESLRKEASQHLQKSESYSHMASWTKQNAGSLNANLNQEYVGWLQKQALPNSKGPMGIREAETILSARPSLDTSYQRRFIEEKMGSFKAGSLPISPETLSSRFKASAPSTLSGRAKSELRERVESSGFGAKFDIKPSISSSVQKKIQGNNTKLSSRSRSLVEQGKKREESTKNETGEN